jgi:hypothetical protein
MYRSLEAKTIILLETACSLASTVGTRQGYLIQIKIGTIRSHLWDFLFTYRKRKLKFFSKYEAMNCIQMYTFTIKKSSKALYTIQQITVYSDFWQCFRIPFPVTMAGEIWSGKCGFPKLSSPWSSKFQLLDWRVQFKGLQTFCIIVQMKNQNFYLKYCFQTRSSSAVWGDIIQGWKLALTQSPMASKKSHGRELC